MTSRPGPIAVVPVTLGPDGIWQAHETALSSPADLVTVPSLERFTRLDARVRCEAGTFSLAVHRSGERDGYVRLSDLPVPDEGEDD